MHIAVDPKIRCKRCGWEGLDSDLDSRCVFYGNQEEPPEYEAQCPSCGEDADNTEEIPLCRTCEDEYVKDEGDQCSECHTCELEEALDAQIYDSMLGG